MTKLIAAVLAAALAASAAGMAGAQEAGDAAAGEKVFRKCAACHKTEPGVEALGPTLFGVVGRDVASLPDFDYSPEMVAWGAGKTWDEALLGTWLEKPREVVEGTRMTFAGLRDAQDRANLIAYLSTLK